MARAFIHRRSFNRGPCLWGIQWELTGLWHWRFLPALSIRCRFPSHHGPNPFRSCMAFASALVFIVGLAIFSLGSANLLKVIQERVAYSVTQYESASGNEEVLSARRLIEYLLIGSQIPDHPILGKGLGATYEISGAAVIEGPADEKVDYHYIHNLYLLIAFRLGIPALLAFLVLLWKYFRNSIRIYRSGSLSPGNSALMAGLIASMFGEVALSMTSPTFLNHPTAGTLACIMVLTLVVPRLKHRLPA